MIKFTVEVQNRVQALIDGAVPEIEGEIERAMQKQGFYLGGRTRQILKQSRKVATGDLARDVAKNPITIKEGRGQFRTTIGTDLEYAAYVHEGTRPHWAPLHALAEWVRVKRLAGRYSSKTKRRLGDSFNRLIEDYSLARSIQLKIAKHGTRPFPFFDMTFDRYGPRVQTKLSRAIGLIITGEFGS